MSVLGLLAPVVAESWEIYYGTAIERLDAMGVEIEDVDDLESLLFVLDVLSALAASGYDAEEELWQTTDIGEICAVFEERFDEDALASSAPDYFDFRFPAEQLTCEQILQLIWTRVDPIADPTRSDYAVVGDPLRCSAVLDGEPFELYLARCSWALSGNDPVLVPNLAAWVARAAIECFGAEAGDLPAGVRPWAERGGAIDKSSRPGVWAALADLGAATVKADGWLLRTSESLWPDPSVDTSSLPSLGYILSSPLEAPVVTDAPSMRAMMAELLEAFVVASQREDVVRYVRRFPMDFRSMFILQLLNNTPSCSDVAFFESPEIEELDPAAYSYLKMRSVPRPSALGRVGPADP